ncbi:hypothetical protein V9T40_000950 [Parthenolecanium corni]|uniref:RRM domain-containing protein n=1 Tax=Parthenolecanium corni TaxID=536013 RepID=A0AAN9TRD5_9HEMI
MLISTVYTLSSLYSLTLEKPGFTRLLKGPCGVIYDATRITSNDLVASYDTSHGFSKYWFFGKSISKFCVASYVTPPATSSVKYADLAPPSLFHFNSEQSNGFDACNPYLAGGVIAPPPPLPPPPLPPPPPPPPTSPAVTSMEVVPAGVPAKNSESLNSITVTNIEKTTTSMSVGTLTTFQPAPIASSPVLMVYDLDPMKTNCDRLFNLFCLYGNVVRIKFLKTKEGCAMVQMSDPYAVDRCMANLNPTDMLDGRELSLGYSKQPFVSENRGSFTLPDGTEGFKDYSSHRHNRYYSRVSSMKNRIQPPSRILHFYNTPTNIAEDELIDIFNGALDGINVVRLKLFPKRGGVDGIVRSSTGLVEFKSVPESVEALMTCNHLPVKSQGNKFPYIMKLCFSAAKNINHIPKEKITEVPSTSVCDKCRK